MPLPGAAMATEEYDIEQGALRLPVTGTETKVFPADSWCLVVGVSGNSCRLAGVTGLIGGELPLPIELLTAVPPEVFRVVALDVATVATVGPDAV